MRINMWKAHRDETATSSPRTDVGSFATKPPALYGRGIGRSGKSDIYLHQLCHFVNDTSNGDLKPELLRMMLAAAELAGMEKQMLKDMARVAEKAGVGIKVLDDDLEANVP